MKEKKGRALKEKEKRNNENMTWTNSLERGPSSKTRPGVWSKKKKKHGEGGLVGRGGKAPSPGEGKEKPPLMEKYEGRTTFSTTFQATKEKRSLQERKRMEAPVKYTKKKGTIE